MKDIKEKLRLGELAVITDIQRYSVHDGPGIRTVVFFKGCPLHCEWCQNPETFKLMPEVIYEKADCIGCTKCIHACSEDAITLQSGILATDRVKCTSCSKCVLVCPSKARRTAGKFYTVGDVFDKIKPDRVFYKNTGGGVTLSGGEVTMQSVFAQNLLLAIKHLKIHTAIETCGYAPVEDFRRVAFEADLVLFDFKHPSPEIHKQYTGVDNVLIHRNLEDIVRAKKKVIVRYPLIPGVNDSACAILESGRYLHDTGIEEIHIMPFHQAGESKWRGLDMRYGFKDRKGIGVDMAKSAADRFKDFGFKVSVGGSGE